MARTVTRSKAKKGTTKWSPALQSRIPEESRYVARWVGDKTDLETLAWAHSKNKNVLLEGPTGAGKTSGVVHYCAKHKIPLVVVQCDGAATVDTVLGRWAPTADGSARWVWGPAALAVMEGAALLFDELNMLPPRTAAGVHPLLDFRRSIELTDHPFTHWCEDHGFLYPQQADRHEHCDGFTEWDGPATIKAKPGTFITATMNEGYGGTYDLNAALVNRFMPMSYGYDSAVESVILGSETLRELADRLRSNDGIFTPVSLPRLMLFEEMVDDEDAGYTMAKVTFLSHFRPEERSIILNVWNDAFEDRLMRDYGLTYED